jgi:hypothetical protein
MPDSSRVSPATRRVTTGMTKHVPTLTRWMLQPDRYIWQRQRAKGHLGPDSQLMCGEQIARARGRAMKNMGLRAFVHTAVVFKKLWGVRLQFGGHYPPCHRGNVCIGKGGGEAVQPLGVGPRIIINVSNELIGAAIAVDIIANSSETD